MQYGDIFFTTSSETPNEVGMSSVLLDDIDHCYLNSFCFGFRLHNSSTFLPEYARYLLRSPIFRRQMYKLAQGSTRYNLSKKALLKVMLPLPTEDEQKEISQVLSMADKEIQLLQQQHTALQQQKKGLMQRLLTGQLRVTPAEPVTNARSASHGAHNLK